MQGFGLGCPGAESLWKPSNSSTIIYGPLFKYSPFATMQARRFGLPRRRWWVYEAMSLLAGRPRSSKAAGPHDQSLHAANPKRTPTPEEHL